MKKILIVDDDKLFLKFQARKLEKKGYEVATAEDGLDALDTIKLFEPEIFFIDYIMPNIDGGQLCKILRNIPAFRSSYIVLISAAAAEMELEFKLKGADACIAKTSFGEMAKQMIALLNDLENDQVEDDRIIGQDKIYKRQMTRELLSHRDHLNTIIESSSEGIIELIGDRIVNLNASATSILGQSKEEIIGLSLLDFLNPEIKSDLAPILTANSEKTAEHKFEKQTSINGRIVTISKPTKTNNYSFSVIFLRDITAQVENEERIMEGEKSTANCLEL